MDASSPSEEESQRLREGEDSTKKCTCVLRRDQEETLLQIKKEPVSGRFCERIVENGSSSSDHLNEDIRQRDGAIKRIYAETGLKYEIRRVL